MKKKGFTLIELLAVIMILAIIALIVTITIGRVIDNAKKETFKESVMNVLKAGEHYIGKYMLDNNQEPTYPITFTCDGTVCTNGVSNLDMSGDVPKSGSVVIENAKTIKSLYLSDGKYCTAGTKKDLLIENSCANIDLTAPTVTGEADERTFKLNLTDNESGIAAYCVTETDDSSSCNWIDTTDTYKEHTVDKNGTFYIFAKDKKNNISNSLSLEAFLLSLGERILRDNPTRYTNPTLSQAWNNTSDATGLYAINTVNGYGGVGNTTYVFRGNPTNNYVSFAGMTWRVLRINEDGTVRLVLNSTFRNAKAVAWNAQNITQTYYTNTNLKTALDSWYQTNIGNNSAYASKVATGAYFCQAARVVDNASDVNGGNASIVSCSNYIPDLSCPTDGNGYGLVTAVVASVTYDEAVFAGGKCNGADSSYLSAAGSYVLMTTRGPRKTSSYTPGWLYSGSGLGNALVDEAQGGRHYARPVINIRNDVGSAGSGTTGDMYTIN